MNRPRARLLVDRRTGVGMGIMVGRVYPELVDNATGEKELPETSYTGTATGQR